MGEKCQGGHAPAVSGSTYEADRPAPSSPYRTVSRPSNSPKIRTLFFERDEKHRTSDLRTGLRPDVLLLQQVCNCRWHVPAVSKPADPGIDGTGCRCSLPVIEKTGTRAWQLRRSPYRMNGGQGGLGLSWLIILSKHTGIFCTIYGCAATPYGEENPVGGERGYH